MSEQRRNLKNTAVNIQRDDDDLDPFLAQSLAEFRQSVHAWSDAAYHRERVVAATASRGKAWRLTAGWALGGALAVFSAGLAVRHQSKIHVADEHPLTQQPAAPSRQILNPAQPQQAQTEEREQATNFSANHARSEESEEEALLTGVDSDVSRQVPSALEPLAQLMDESK